MLCSSSPVPGGRLHAGDGQRGRHGQAVVHQDGGDGVSGGPQVSQELRMFLCVAP